MNARPVASWSVACILIVLSTTNPTYKVLVLAAALVVLAAAAGLPRLRGLLFGVFSIAVFAALLNFVSAHLGSTVLFSLPSQLPALGGPYTLEAIVFGAFGGVTIAAAILAVAPFSLLLSAHDVMDALPGALSRTGVAVATSMNLVPLVAASYVQVSEAQRLRGLRPRGPRSLVDVIVPVVLTSVEGSIQLAESMEARGFGSGPRTSMRSSHLGRRDWLVIAASAAAVVLFVTSRLAGWAVDWFPYPSLVAPPIDVRPVAACLLLFTPVLVWRSRSSIA